MHTCIKQELVSEKAQPSHASKARAADYAEAALEEIVPFKKSAEKCKIDLQL